jgi:hypothetical protein
LTLARTASTSAVGVLLLTPSMVRLRGLGRLSGCRCCCCRRCRCCRCCRCCCCRPTGAAAAAAAAERCGARAHTPTHPHTPSRPWEVCVHPRHTPACAAAPCAGCGCASRDCCCWQDCASQFSSSLHCRVCVTWQQQQQQPRDS